MPHPPGWPSLANSPPWGSRNEKKCSTNSPRRGWVGLELWIMNYANFSLIVIICQQGRKLFHEAKHLHNSDPHSHKPAHYVHDSSGAAYYVRKTTQKTNHVNDNNFFINLFMFSAILSGLPVVWIGVLFENLCRQDWLLWTLITRASDATQWRHSAVSISHLLGCEDNTLLWLVRIRCTSQSINQFVLNRKKTARKSPRLSFCNKLSYRNSRIFCCVNVR